MTSYTELAAEVPISAFARNQELIGHMEQVIERAQIWVVNRLDHDAFRASRVAITIANDGIITKPADMLELRAVQLRYRGRGWTALRRRSEEMLETLYASEPPGFPTFYAETEDNYLVFPKPSRDMEARVLYNANPPLLSPTVDTNVLTDDYPEVIRAATMREAAIFMGDASLIPVFSEETTEVLSAANAAIARKRRDETGQKPIETTNARGQ